ncbi:hypothetical protein, partial [Burkholderia pseudomallei]|uniref:hypothetical protein n=1 Tax=Burkholderia pseudomallei TaxID=28450 RepID=UPI001CA59DA5
HCRNEIQQRVVLHAHRAPFSAWPKFCLFSFFLNIPSMRFFPRMSPHTLAVAPATANVPFALLT